MLRASVKFLSVLIACRIFGTTRETNNGLPLLTAIVTLNAQLRYYYSLVYVD